MAKTELDPKEIARRLKEDALARNHQGYFKLWSMKLSRGRDGNWGHLPWIKDKLLGTFPSRDPCEAALDLIEHGPWMTYTFHRFTQDIDGIVGYWEVEVDKEGKLVESDRINFLSPRWVSDDWHKRGIDYEDVGDWNGGAKFHGRARTKARALELALEAKAKFEEFVRVERPKRAEGCYCDPWDKKPCGKCEKQTVEQRKQACGCPSCKGDHEVSEERS